MSKISPITPSLKAEAAKLNGSRVANANLPCEGYGEPAEPSQAQRIGELEARLTMLENAMFEHAVMLRDRIGQRLDRLEQKFRYEADGLRRALKDESRDRNSKIIQLSESVTNAVDRVESRQIDTSEMGDTLRHLMSALADTRNHLDHLAEVVENRHFDDDGGLVS